MKKYMLKMAVAPCHITADERKLVFENAKAFNLDRVLHKEVIDKLEPMPENRNLRNMGMDR